MGGRTWRTYLRGHKNILKRQLIHLGAFNLSLILRQLMGAGTPSLIAPSLVDWFTQQDSELGISKKGGPV
jgi:hypothetical protein